MQELKVCDDLLHLDNTQAFVVAFTDLFVIVSTPCTGRLERYHRRDVDEMRQRWLDVREGKPDEVPFDLGVLGERVARWTPGGVSINYPNGAPDHAAMSVRGAMDAALAALLGGAK